MAQSIVDPEQQRQFASNLRARALTMAELSFTIKTHFGTLGETWQDNEYTAFLDRLDDTTRKLMRFVEAADVYCSFLLRKAEAGEAYLRRRV